MGVDEITTAPCSDRRTEDYTRESGRNTMGMKMVNLDAGGKLQAIAPVISEDKAGVVEGSEPAK